MIKVQFMRCKSDRKKITKVSSTIGQELECELKENTSIIEPTIRVSAAKIGKDYAGVNYAYIPDFGRYYFVDAPIAETGQILSFNMTVDVLRSYRDDLLTTPFEVARSEAINSKFFIDTEKALMVRKVVEYLPIGNVPQSASGNKYTITVAGGVV